MNEIAPTGKQWKSRKAEHRGPSIQCNPCHQPTHHPLDLTSRSLDLLPLSTSRLAFLRHTSFNTCIQDKMNYQSQLEIEMCMCQLGSSKELTSGLQSQQVGRPSSLTQT